MDVLLVLTALALFVGLRTLALVRSRRAVAGRRAIVDTVLPPHPAAPPSRSAGAGARWEAATDEAAAPPGGEPLPTRRSLRRRGAEAAATASTAAEPVLGVAPARSAPTQGPPAQLAPPRRARPVPAGDSASPAHAGEGRRARASQRSAA